MPLFYLRLAALLALLFSARLGCAQTINTDAAAAYWKITDALHRNQPLTDAAWQQFLEIPANKVYVRAVFGSDTADLGYYRRALQTVYMPRYDSLLQAKLKAKRWYYVLINDYKEHEQDYRSFLAETASNPTYLEKMYTYAYEYLPARDHKKASDLRLAYVAISNDATSQAEGIVFSLRAARDWNAIRPGALEAHEMHHRLRSTKDWKVTPADDPLLTGLYLALNEGLADLTDKKIMLEHSADSLYIHNWLLKPAPGVIQQLDSTIRVQAAGGPATPEKFYRHLTNGTNGHLPGFYMAYLILRNGYLKPMLDHADDPIAFALLYQKAAKKDKYHQHPPLFSTASVSYLKQLGRKYAKPQPATN